MLLLLLSIAFLATTVTTHCPTTTPVAPGPPKCADYPDGYFINDYSNCQAYYFCPNATSPPYPGKCSEPYNFDQNSQLCNHPDDYECPSEQCVAAVGGKVKLTRSTTVDFIDFFFFEIYFRLQECSHSTTQSLSKSS